MDKEDCSKGDDGQKLDPIDEYCKKFSQNRQLPRYFRGSSVSYLPEVADLNEGDRKHNQQESLTKTKEGQEPEGDCMKKTSVTENIEDKLSEGENEFERSKIASPASSLASNKKLEWDNGADIGYDNCNRSLLHKSLSLPILNNPDDDNDRKDKEDTKSHSHDQKEIAAKEQSAHVISVLHPYTSSSSSSNYINNRYTIAHPSSSSSNNNLPGVIASSSSSDNDLPYHASENFSATSEKLKLAKQSKSSSSSLEREKISKFTDTLMYLKRKIGIPDAESTPKEFECGNNKDTAAGYTATPVVKKAEKPQKLLSENFSKVDVKSPSKRSKHSQDHSNLRIGSIAHISSSCENLYQYVKKNQQKSNNQSEISIHHNKFNFKPRKVVNLCKTKPVFVECIDKKKLGDNKKIQTSLTTNKSSKSTQTDDVDYNTLINLVENANALENCENVIYIELSDSNEASPTKSSITQTDFTGFSSPNSGTFEYVSGDHFKEKFLENKENISTTNTRVSRNNEPLPSHEAQHSGTLKRSNPKEDLSKMNSVSSSLGNSSRNVPLGNLISAHTSDQLLTDINKSIALLQKLIKSQKYDSNTKKHYIKKIMQKIVDSNCLEESSTSSELFRPKKSTSDNINIRQNKIIKSTDSSSDGIKKSPEKTKLESNVPWFPAKTSRLTETQKLSPKKQRKLQIQTHSEEILPELKDKYKILLKQTEGENSAASRERVIPSESSEECWTEKPNEALIIQNSKSDHNSRHKNLTPTTSGGGDTHDSNLTSSSRSSQNWREDKTVSEQLFEQHKAISLAQGDHLVQYAKNERRNQISWINNEIDHLSKLRHLLEKTPKVAMKRDYMYGEANFDNMKGIKKTTTVYMVSENYDGRRSGTTSQYCSARNSQSGSARSGRNFVIQTELTDTTSSDEIRFRLADSDGHRSYTCSQLLPKGQKPKPPSKLVGDIKVSTEDNTTNIVVKAKRSEPGRAPRQPNDNGICICKQTPCVCCFVPKKPVLVGSGVYQYSTFPRSATESKFSSSTVVYCKKPSCPSNETSVRPLSSCRCSRSDTEYVPCPKLSESESAVVCKGTKIKSILCKDKEVECCVCRNTPCVCRKTELEYKEVPCPYAGKHQSSNEKCPCFDKDDLCEGKDAVRKCKCKEKVQCTCCNKRRTSDKKCLCLKRDDRCEVEDAFKTCKCGEKRHCNCCKKSVLLDKKCHCLKQDNPCEDKDAIRKCKCGEKLQCNCCNKWSSLEKKCQCCRRGGKDAVIKFKEAVQCSCCKKHSLSVPCKDEKVQCTCCKTEPSSDKKCKCKEANAGGQAGGFHCNCCRNRLPSGSTKGDSTQIMICKCNEAVQCPNKRPPQTKGCSCQKPVEPCEDKNTQMVECRCDEKTQCDCGMDNCKCNEFIQTPAFAKEQDVQCTCGIRNCKCNEKIQTECVQKDTKSQVEYLCNSEELQTVECKCEPRFQQTEFPCIDENLQSKACSCCSNVTQTRPCPKQDEKMQTACECSEDAKVQAEWLCSQDAKVQAKCKCSDTSNQCECTCDTEPPEKLELEPEEFCPCSSEESSSSESSETESSESLVECVCCKQRRPPCSKYAELKDKLDNARPLCHPCMRQNQRMPWTNFNSPQHVCKCYTMVQTSTFNEIKRTINELNCMEQLEQHCTCPNIRNKKSAKYCRYCKCKLEGVDTNKNGIAYMVTFDYEKPKKKKHKRKDEPRLEEIKIRIPYHKKKHKNKENEKRKVRYYQGRSDSNVTASEGASSVGGGALQDYLRMNRPDFIENLERRRKAVIVCKSQREENNELKKLLYLKEQQQQPAVELANPKVRRYFTPKEMREINERNYKRLPEVQQKLRENKERQLKQANRLITDQFNEKLRAQVLRGKRSLPTDVNVVSLVCRRSR